MAKRKTASAERRPAELSPQRIKAAIPKLERRLRELEEARVDTWDETVRNELNALQLRVDDTLMEIFGPDSTDYKRHQVTQFWIKVPHSGMDRTLPQGYIRGYREAIEEAKSKVRTALSILEERLRDMGESPGGQALQAIEGLDLHPEIEQAAGAPYRDNHYSNAIEDAVKALNGLVKLRSGMDNLDGTTLMERVFNPKDPVLRFNELADESDRNQQKGYMMLYSGAVTGLRNPRAHKLMVDDAERALEFIAFVSLLAKLLDDAERVRD